MKSTLLFFFLGFAQWSFAQSYNRLLGAENYWHVTSCNFGCTTDLYWATEDTVINNKPYKFLDGYHYNKNMLIREDTISKKVFFRLRTGTPPIKEYLLYDFSLLVGDSMEIVNPISPLPSSSGIYVVDSIRLITIKDGPHRVFYLSEIAGSNRTLWVEGVGSLCLINTPGGLPDIYGVGDLTCFFKDGVHVYQSDSLLNGMCDTLSTAAAFVPDIAAEINLFPNPSKGSITLDFGKERANISLVVLNGLGQAIQTQSYEAVRFIELELSVPTGLYFLQIALEGVVLTKKVFRE